MSENIEINEMNKSVSTDVKVGNTRDIAIQITCVKKRYRLGAIGGGTLRGDIQSWWARIRGKEDPNSKIGAKKHVKNEIFFALDDINLTVYKGERLGIIGHNGAGKSTLLKLLSHVTAPTEGKICIDGRISSMLEVGTGFNGELTGRQNIYLNGAILGMSKAEVDAKIDDIIEFSECEQFIDTPVKRYSSGMYVKLAFAVAAHLDSEILVMDEVLAVGDMKFQTKCLGKMGSVSQEEGRTVLYVSHNMNTIRTLCDRCVVLDHGKIIYDGDVETAIDIYLEKGKVDRKISYKMQGELPQKYQARILSASIIDNDMGTYQFGDKLKFNINFSAFKDVQDINFRCMIKNKKEEPVGITFFENFNLEKGETNKEFVLDLYNLAPETYSLQIVLSRDNGLGAVERLELIKNLFYFEVVAPENFCNNLTWGAKDWGYVKFPDIEEIKK